MKDRAHSIFVIAGGTAGHLFPAIALTEELQKDGFDVTLLHDDRSRHLINKYKPTSILSFEYSLEKPGRSFPEKIRFIYSILKALLKLVSLFIAKKPKLIIGFGGYPTLPPLILAKILRIKIALHEQNSVLGKVNRLFAKGAHFIALSFKDTEKMPKGLENKSYITGIPIMWDLHNAKIEHNFHTKYLRILVIGGSQGAAIFSDIVPDAIAKLPLDMRQQINVTQQAKDFLVTYTENKYQAINVQYKIDTFLRDVPILMLNHDIVISRSGASTIAELTATGTPSILIPLPYSADNHQLKNAVLLKEHGASEVIQESDASPESLARLIGEIFVNRAILSKMSTQALQFYIQDPCGNIISLVKNVLGIFH